VAYLPNLERWRAEVVVAGAVLELGSFGRARDAALAYDDAVRALQRDPRLKRLSEVMTIAVCNFQPRLGEGTVAASGSGVSSGEYDRMAAAERAHPHLLYFLQRPTPAETGVPTEEMVDAIGDEVALGTPPVSEATPIEMAEKAPSVEEPLTAGTVNAPAVACAPTAAMAPSTPDAATIAVSDRIQAINDKDQPDDVVEGAETQPPLVQDPLPLVSSPSADAAESAEASSASGGRPLSLSKQLLGKRVNTSKGKGVTTDVGDKGWVSLDTM